MSCISCVSLCGVDLERRRLTKRKQQQTAYSNIKIVFRIIRSQSPGSYFTQYTLFTSQILLEEEEVIFHLPDSWSNWNLEKLVFEEKGNRSTRRKTSRSKGENQQQTQPTYGVDTRIWTRATLVGGERSDHCAIPCSPTMETILTQN